MPRARSRASASISRRRWRTRSASRSSFIVAPTTGELTDASTAGRIDIGFTPVDEERKQRVDFSPPYFIIESTYLVTAASGIRTQDEVDRPEVTVARHRRLDHHSGRRAHAEKREDRAAEIGRGRHGDDASRNRPGARAQPRRHARLAKGVAGLARSRRRFPSDGGRDVGAEEQARGARLCDALLSRRPKPTARSVAPSMPPACRILRLRQPANSGARGLYA